MGVGLCFQCPRQFPWICKGNTIYTTASGHVDGESSGNRTAVLIWSSSFLLIVGRKRRKKRRSRRRRRNRTALLTQQQQQQQPATTAGRSRIQGLRRSGKCTGGFENSAKYIHTYIQYTVTQRILYTLLILAVILSNFDQSR